MESNSLLSEVRTIQAIPPEPTLESQLEGELDDAVVRPAGFSAQVFARVQTYSAKPSMVLGASRGRVIRQLILESLLFSTMGGILGCGIAWLAIRGLVGLAPVGLPRINEIVIDGRVLLFVTAVSAASGILFGLAPALALARTNLVDTLKNRGQHRGSASSASQSLVVVAEISICFVLLISGGLLVRSLIRLSHVDPGSNPSNLLAVQLTLPMQNYQGPQILSAYQRMFADLESLPGVTAVMGSSYAPFQEDRNVSTRHHSIEARWRSLFSPSERSRAAFSP